MRSRRSTSAAVRSRFATNSSQRSSPTSPSSRPLRRQAQVGVVLAQQQAIFRAAREHPIRLARAARDEIVDQHADVGLVAARPPRRALLHAQRRIDAGEDALRGGLFVAGRAVDLAREEQAGDELRLQAVLQVARIEVVVLDRVAGPRHVRALEARDRAHQRELHVERQAGRDAVRVDLVRRQAFRLDEDLVRGLVGEAMHLVLDRRAVARADAFDHAGEHRRAVAAGADDLVRALVGRSDVATDLARMIGCAGRGTRTPAPARRRAAPRGPCSRSCGRRCAAACRS